MGGGGGGGVPRQAPTFSRLFQSLITFNHLLGEENFLAEDVGALELKQGCRKKEIAPFLLFSADIWKNVKNFGGRFSC